MTICVNDVFLPVEHSLEEVYDLAVKKSGVSKSNVKNIYVRKKSIDARGGEIKFVYSVSISLLNSQKVKLSSKVTMAEEFDYKIECNKALPDRPLDFSSAEWGA